MPNPNEICARAVAILAAKGCKCELSAQAQAIVQALCEELNKTPRCTGNVSVIMNEKSLRRVEDRIKWIRGYTPLPKDSPMFLELQELKVEQTRLKNELGFKA